MNLTKPQKLIYDMERFAGRSINVICGCMLLPGAKPEAELVDGVNRVFQLNDALRIRIAEENGQPSQTVLPYTGKNIDILHFASKAELDSYAQKSAETPFDFYGDLCNIQVVILPDQYGLLVKFHHIVGDAWTIALIGTQFNTIVNGEEPSACSYCEYVESEKEYLESQRYENDRTFFLKQFKKCDEVTYLSEKQAASYSATRKTFVLDADKTQQIKDYATQSKSSAYALFMTVLAIYMNRTHMNAEKFYLGTAVLNRSGIREKQTMGMFVNTVPMLIELENGNSFADNLAAMGKTIFSAFRHQKFNYGDVLSAIRKEYNFSEKLYDIMLSYQNATISGGDCETTWYHCGMQNESLQIHIDDRDREGIFRIHYDYQTDKFTVQEIETLHHHLMTLLQDAIKNDAKKLYELELLPSEEKQKVLFDFNDTAMDYPRDKCVHQLFEEQVESTPDKVAVIACDRTLTYAQLNEQANRIAHALIGYDVQVGDIVAFALPRKSDLIATMLGILKAGAAYLPIDSDYPQERIAYILEDSQAKLFVTEDNIKEFLNNSDSTNPHVSMSSENLCYCIFTSGSTGKPKGTLLNHRGIVNLVTDLSIYGNLSNCNRIGFMTTITFDVATQEILTALLNGFTGVLMPERKETRADVIIDGIIENKVDIMYATPTYFDSLTDTVEKAEKLLSSIKVVCLAGEKFSLNPNVLEVKDKYNVIFENQYGPVELHVIATAATVTDLDFDSIGKPVHNDKAYIVDQYMRPTPTGVIGELCVAGDGVGVGYLNRPELTEEKFIDNPFGEGKLYKTGDLAYWREDGNIVYVGRNDFQVKIRGLRIELGEIENAICGVDGISQAVVVVRKNVEGRQLICAFYTGEEVDTKAIRSHIGKKLPKYMLPHICTHLDFMPLTTSGKVNRKALPEVDLYSIETSVEYIPPVSEQEKALTAAIGTVLGIGKVSLVDNFFDLGGDSLKSIELISKLDAAGYHTEVKTIFECDTVKALAEKLISAEEDVAEFTYEGDIPVTAAQMRVYTAQEMHHDSTVYNVPYAFRASNLDVNKLQMAVDSMLDRHEILRTSFENKDGNIVQVITPTAACIVEKLESDDMGAFMRPFNLSKAPLLRVGYCGNTVMIDMHHIITDGGSMPIFLNELNELYMGRVLPNTNVPYKQFAVQKQDHAESEKYWLSVFGDELPALEINTDKKRGQKQSINGKALYDAVDIVLHKQILAKCKQLNITPYAFYMGAFNILLSKFSGSEDVVVGMPISGRESKYLNTIGMFVNTIALRNQPDSSMTVQAFLGEVKENSVNAIAHQDYPYGELVKKLNINTPGRNPMFDVMFAYQSERMTDVVFGDERAELLPVLITTSKYDFTFNVMPRETDVVLMVEYCTDLYTETMIQRLVDSYMYILKQMLDVEKRICAISAVTDAERKLLADFNDTAMDYPRDKCVHQLFEEQVKRTPDKVAVIAQDKTLTYAELNEQANRIAHSLIAQGIGLGDIVAFALPRKSYLISTIFGILKCGAAYLPLDIDYPRDRINEILRDSKAVHFITESNIGDLLDQTLKGDIDLDIPSEAMCYCIYTSGSTGKPKGVLIRHRNLVNFCQVNDKNRYQQQVISNNDTLISTFNVCFDGFGVDYALFLLNGRSIILISKDSMLDANVHRELVERYDASAIQSTPSVMQALCENANYGLVLRRANSIMLAAENLTADQCKFLRSASAAELYNGYGPSETTIGVSFGCITDCDEIHIGKPSANTQIYIADGNMQLVPIGVTGELCIAGDGVGAGYLNRPELTAEKFIDNPFGEGKLYKTGDLAYWRKDGNIAFVGRNDFQVKIRGLRVELGEIENAISGIDGISQAVVDVRKNSEGRQLICAFYTGDKVDAREIRSHIGKKLPKYMLPHICTHLVSMPLTSSGKVNRKALPDVVLDNTENELEYVAPVTLMQKALCKLLESLLGITPIGLADNFFDLGGDSLKAIEFVSKAHSEGIYFNLQNVFDYPTVGELVAFIENGDKQTVSFDNVDFTSVNCILERNTAEHIAVPGKQDVGNMLLAGATGFLGIHILADYLEHDVGTAYCLVRGKDKEDAIQRLKDLLQFYFGNKFADMDRIEVVCADLQKDLFGLHQEEYEELKSKIDTVINTAASVKHYGSYQYFYEANVETTKHLIDFCKCSGAKLIHTSTLSVSGNGFGDQFDGYISKTEKHFYESSMYIGQPLDNVYARSKFEAEKAVLDAVADGLQANIMRMGNLTNRLSDGLFQKNYKSNAFLQRVSGVLELGLFPKYLIKDTNYTEFTPIDEAATAVMTIVRHFSIRQTVFHINSIKVVYFDKLVEIINQLGYDLKLVDGAIFTEALRQTAKQAGMEHIFETFINDMDENDQLNYDSNIRIENDFTVEYLRKLGFEWSDIGIDYLRKYVAYFKRIGHLK